MSLISSIEQAYREASWNERLILLAAGSLFLPYPVAAAIMAIILVVFACHKDLMPAIREMKGRWLLFSFCILEILVSLLYRNWIGLLNAGGYLMIAMFVAVYRKTLTKQLFQTLLEQTLVLSWIAGLIGLIQYGMICYRNDLNFFAFDIQHSSFNRVSSTFENPNFYAVLCCFFILFCLYEYIHHSSLKLRIYYVITAMMNGAMLLLTGCRTALLPFLFIFPLFFFLARKKRLFVLSFAAELWMLVLVLTFPELIPRIDNLHTLFTRIEIWQGAITLIALHPLLGCGPQTYGFLAKSHGLKWAPHAHNLLLDSLCSFGMIGTALGIGYFVQLLDEATSIYGKNRYSSLYALVICFMITALVLGLLDVSLNFLPTGTMFMMAVNSSVMLVQKEKNPRPWIEKLKAVSSKAR